jgi:hypothetical protein
VIHERLNPNAIPPVAMRRGPPPLQEFRAQPLATLVLQVVGVPSGFLANEGAGESALRRWASAGTPLLKPFGDRLSLPPRPPPSKARERMGTAMSNGPVCEQLVQLLRQGGRNPRLRRGDSLMPLSMRSDEPESNGSTSPSRR